MTLADLIPEPTLLLALSPEELGLQLLKLASKSLQNGIFSIGSVTNPDRLFGDGFSHYGTTYPTQYANEIELAVGEAWQWLENNLLIIPAPQPNNSFKRFTRRGLALAKDEAAFATYAASANFPKALLHPSIANDVWIQLSQGSLAVAVFIAFRAVEEAVRYAGGFRPEDIGVNLMRLAFNKDSGPLRRASDPEAEREALAALFAGAIGSYKNPHSHRTVEISDPGEAHEMTLLASHLLRIVDDRRPRS